MKKYENPILEIVETNDSDIITTSPGTTGPTIDEDNGNWGFGIGL